MPNKSQCKPPLLQLKLIIVSHERGIQVERRVVQELFNANTALTLEVFIPEFYGVGDTLLAKMGEKRTNASI